MYLFDDRVVFFGGNGRDRSIFAKNIQLRLDILLGCFLLVRFQVLALPSPNTLSTMYSVNHSIQRFPWALFSS